MTTHLEYVISFKSDISKQQKQVELLFIIDIGIYMK